MPILPNVIQRSGQSERITDIFSRLLSDRIVMLTSEIDDILSTLITCQLLYLQSEDAKSVINLYINSPGGSVDSALAIYDTIQYISAPVHTTVMGMAASAATVISMSGKKRYILPNARMMIHQVIGGTKGQYSDIKIHFTQMSKVYDKIVSLYIKHTKEKDIDKMKSYLDRDTYLNAEEALSLGLVDEICYPA